MRESTKQHGTTMRRERGRRGGFVLVGIFLGQAGCPVQALVTSVATSFRGYSAPSLALQRARGSVRRTRPRDMRLSAAGGNSGAGDIDSSEIYADMRRRLEELRRSGTEDGTPTAAEDVSDLGLFQQQEDGQDGGGGDFPGGGGGAAAAAAGGAKMYSAQEMKQRYYEAFWRARNLHKEAKFGGTSSSGSKEDSSSDASSPPATPPPEAQAASRTTTLTPLALDMFLSGTAAAEADSAAAASSSSDDVQGLTQMYYLVEEEEEAAAASAISSHRPPVSEASAGLVETAAAAAGVAPLSLGKQGLRSPRQTGAMAAAAAAALEYQQAAFSSSGEEGPPAVASSSGGTAAAVAAASSMSTEPQGLTQVFYLDPEDEAEAAAALPVVPGRSFLRERLGVSGEVVQGLRQVELDHARLAMVAVLMSGVVGAGAGAGAGVYLNAHDGFSALAEVARTPWLDPYVAGGILAAKALSEGDWRIGKGALAAFADRVLSSLSDTGAKVLRVGSGNELRRLAVEIEVKHGRMALGAVVCAMAQQGILTVAA